jgi:hypothetical protein
LSLAAAIVVATSALAVSAASAAATRDQTSDHAALVAIERFMSAQLTGVPVAAGDADAFVTSASAQCPNVLAAIALLPPTPQNTAVMTAFAGEVGADISIAGNEAYQTPFTNLANSLAKLRWATSRNARAVQAFVAAGRQVLSQSPSAICVDADIIATSQAETMPPSTLAALARFTQTGTRMQDTTNRMLRALTAQPGAGDAALMRQINRLSNRLNTLLTGRLTAEAKKLFTGLGLPTG